MKAKKRRRRRYEEKEARRGRFSRRMEAWSREFDEEMSDFGERVRKRIRSRVAAYRWKNWWYDRLGFAAPIVGSILGIVCLALFAWFLSLLDFGAQGFFSSLSSFFLTNIALFFAASLLFEYAKYVDYVYPEFFWAVVPLVDALGAVWAAWIVMSVLFIVDFHYPTAFLASVAAFIFGNFAGIFVLFLVLGYAFLPFRRRWRRF